MDSRPTAKSCRSTVSFERSTVRKYRGTAMVNSTPMMVMTTSNSISVKPAAFRLPLMIHNPVQSLALRHRVHIENVVSGLRIRRWALITAQSPRIRRRNRGVRKKRVARHAPQKINHRFLFALLILDAVDQHLQVRRVSRITQFEADAAAVGRVVVRIDRAAQDAQRLAQLALFF